MRPAIKFQAHSTLPRRRSWLPFAAATIAVGAFSDRHRGLQPDAIRHFSCAPRPAALLGVRCQPTRSTSRPQCQIGRNRAAPCSWQQAVLHPPQVHDFYNVLTGIPAITPLCPPSSPTADSPTSSPAATTTSPTARAARKIPASRASPPLHPPATRRFQSGAAKAPIPT